MSLKEHEYRSKSKGNHADGVVYFLEHVQYFLHTYAIGKCILNAIQALQSLPQYTNETINSFVSRINDVAYR